MFSKILAPLDGGAALDFAPLDSGAGLIGVTVKNRSRLGKLLMGSQTQQIILSADVPVLCVAKA